MPNGKASGSQKTVFKTAGTIPIYIADYFALSRARFAARVLLQTNLLCVLGEVISEREADLVRDV